VVPSDSRKSANCESTKAASVAYRPLPYALFEDIRTKVRRGHEGQAGECCSAERVARYPFP
jgi:hypothetical protein